MATRPDVMIIPGIMLEKAWENLNKEDVVYFELDNWFCGRDYPNAAPFINWVKYGCFTNDGWCKRNQLCVEAGPIDMSLCYCITASRSWVEEHCPDLLTDGECGSHTIISQWDDEKNEVVAVKKYESCKFSKFVCHPNSDGQVYGRISGWPFRKYCEENFGVHWNNWYDEELEDEEEDDE